MFTRLRLFRRLLALGNSKFVLFYSHLFYELHFLIVCSNDCILFLRKFLVLEVLSL